MIERIFVIALFTMGYCCTFWEGMIFERIGNWMEAYAPEWLWKPLGGCYICACMWVGSAVYWWLVGNWRISDLTRWPDWLICCICAMGVNAIFSQLANKQQDDNVN